MNFTKRVAAIKKLQEQYVAIQNKIKTGVGTLDKEVSKYAKERLKEEFPGVNNFHLLTSFHCGSQTNQWKPQVFLYDVNEYSYSGSYWYDNFHAKNKVEPPVPTRRLLAVLKDISAETGIKVTLVRQKPLWEADKFDFKNLEDYRPMTEDEMEIQYC